MDAKHDVHIVWFELLVAGADKGFRSLDQFANWFIGGTAAVFAFFIGNLDRIPGLEPGEMTEILPYIVAAFALILFAKFLGSLICAKAGSLERMSALLEARESRGHAMPSPEAFFAEQKTVLPWPVRATLKLLSQTPADQARRVMWSMLIAGLSTLIAAGFTITAWIKLTIALT